MNVTGIAATLRQRWKGHYDTGLSSCFGNALTYAEAVSMWRAEAAKDSSLTDVGVRRAVRAKAAKNGVHNDLRRISEKVDQAVVALTARREALGRPKRAADAIEEARRRELRDHLMRLTPAARIAAAMADSDMAEALLDAPSAAVMGLAPEVLAQIRDSYSKATQADGLRLIAEAEEAVTLTRAAFETALIAVKAETGLGGRAFDQWLDSGVDPDLQPATV